MKKINKERTIMTFSEKHPKFRLIMNILNEGFGIAGNLFCIISIVIFLVALVAVFCKIFFTKNQAIDIDKMYDLVKAIIGGILTLILIPSFFAFYNRKNSVRDKIILDCFSEIKELSDILILLYKKALLEIFSIDELKEYLNKNKFLLVTVFPDNLNDTLSSLCIELTASKKSKENVQSLINKCISIIGKMIGKDFFSYVPRGIYKLIDNKTSSK